MILVVLLCWPSSIEEACALRVASCAFGAKCSFGANRRPRKLAAASALSTAAAAK